VVDGLAVVAEFLARSNQADGATMERLSETIARQALAVVDRDPDHSLSLGVRRFVEVFASRGGFLVVVIEWSDSPVTKHRSDLLNVGPLLTRKRQSYAIRKSPARTSEFATRAR